MPRKKMSKEREKRLKKEHKEEFLEFALPHKILRKEGTSSRETAEVMMKGLKQHKKARSKPGLWQKPGFAHLREQLIFEAYMQGMPSDKIASIFGISKTHIKLHLYTPSSMRGLVTGQEKHYLAKRGAQLSWDKMSAKKRKERKNKVKKGQQAYWKNLSKKEREEISERVSKRTTEVWENLSEKEREQRLRGINEFLDSMSPEDWSEHAKSMRTQKTSKELEKWYGKISEAKKAEWEQMGEKDKKERTAHLEEAGRAFWETLTEKEKESFVEERREESRYWHDHLPKKKQKKLKDIFTEHLIMLGKGEDPRMVSASMSIAMTEFWEDLAPKYRKRKPKK